MFFHPFLLQSQHRMQLNLPWKAATVGTKKMKKNVVINCNIVKVCDQIIIFVTSDSLNPQKRFSLRLSSILICGVCRILRQQVIYLNDEINRYNDDRQRAANRLLEFHESEDTEPTPKPTIKKKRVSRKEEETPDSLVERIRPVIPRGSEGQPAEPEFTLEPLRFPEVPVEEGIIQSRVDDITLREEIPRRLEYLTDDFGPLEEILIHPIASTSEVREITTTVDVPATKSQKSPRRSEGTSSPKLKEYEIAVPQVDEPAKAVEQEIPQILIEEMQETIAPPLETAQVILAPPAEKESNKDAEQAPVAVVVEPEVEIRARRGVRKDGRDVASSLLLKRKRRKFAFVNQAQKTYNEDDIPNVMKTIPNFKPMLKFWPNWDKGQLDVDAARPTRDTSSVRGSGATLGLAVEKSDTPQLPETSVAFPQQIETPPSVTSEFNYVLTPRKRPRQSNETVEEVMPPAANGVAMGPPEIAPRKRRKVVTIEEVGAIKHPTEEGLPELVIPEDQSEIQPIATSEIHEILPQEEQRPTEEMQPPAVEELMVDRVEKGKSPEKRMSGDEEGRVRSPRVDYLQVEFGVKWSREIIEVIYQHHKIAAPKICRKLNKRRTKLNMSIVFATLLSLAKDRYVLLHSAEDSCELEFIERGPEEFIL